jgi:hypothetical protein
MASMITINLLRFLYFNVFSASFYITFLSDGIATSINKQILFTLFLIFISCFLAKTSLFFCMFSVYHQQQQQLSTAVNLQV